jgi:microsomal epoxide hydrolase
VTEDIRPFRIDVPDAVLIDLRDRLARTRWPDQIPGTEWDYGTEESVLRELCDYWRNIFDWRKAEASLNQWTQFETEIDGVHLHFIHARSPEPDAFPLVITHGWPGSISEFLKILGPLTDPAAHGSDRSNAFHVVAPSMPGYGFSGPTTRTGIDIRAVGQLNAALMARLGYERYGAQGGDWGAIASVQSALVDPEHVAGIHLNMAVARAPDSANPLEGVGPEEAEGLGAMDHFRKEETGYQSIQGTKPQTLAYGLTDSPAGLAGWILEKFRTWSDCNGDVWSRFTRDEVLTNITLYWVTGTINASTRMYYETMKSRRFGGANERVEVPTGVALFPKELFRPPRKWVEDAYNLVHWTRMQSGGHFAALEEPELLVDDIRTFFRGIR